jgi:inosose dehydratase
MPLNPGFSPITWNNEDLPDLRPHVPYERVLGDVRAAGFEGTELGDGFPRDPERLRAALRRRGLEMPSAWCGLDLAGEGSESSDLDCVRRMAELVAAVGGSFLNLAHRGTPERLAVAGRASHAGVPRLCPIEWERVAARCEMAGRIARAYGVQAVFHQHVGTYVETVDEVEELARRVDPALVGWCFDAGHAIYAGIDPVDFIRRHADRIRYVHLKDVDPAVLAQLRAEGLGWEAGLRRFVFAELGSGVLDLGGVIEALREIGYEGWLMVEQDTSRLEPIEAARAARAALRAVGV